MDRPIVVIDTETATVRGSPHLLEIAAVRAIDGEIVEHFETLVRSEVPIEPEACAYHGITDDDIRDAPTAPEALERFSTFVGDDWMAAHNAGFDAAVLGFEYLRHGLEMPRAPILDTLRLARRFIPEASDHKLATLCQHLELDAPVHHRALPDAVHCWKVLEECMVRARERAQNTVLRARESAQHAAGAASAAQDSAPAAAQDNASVATHDSARGDAHAPAVADEPSWAALLEWCGAALWIHSAAPRPPRMAQRLRPLEAACRARTSVMLVYGEEGGVANLAVVPRFLYQHDKKGYLEAQCERSGLLKTYRLDRVHKVRER